MQWTKDQKTRFSAIRKAQENDAALLAIETEALVSLLVDREIIKLDDWLARLEDRHRLRQALKFTIRG